MPDITFFLRRIARLNDAAASASAASAETGTQRVGRDGGNVLFIASDDSVAIDLKPRLVAAAAAVKRRLS